jgi:hypothetical protein
VLVFVIVFNCIVALLCLVVAWQFWKLRRKLAKATRILERAERGTQRVLSRAPSAILKGQTGTQSLRQNLQALEPKLARLQQIQKLLGLLALGQRVLQPTPTLPLQLGRRARKR